MEVFAHRGNSGEAPENTLAAFRQVQDTGAAGAEFDVQLSRDGVPVVIHDETLERTTSGKGWVGDFPLADLQTLDAGRWFNPSFSNERIPTLEAVLDLFRGTALRMNIELKTNRRPYPGLVPQVLEVVRRMGMEQQALISSFNHHTLHEARALAPHLEYAVLVSEQLLQPWAYVTRYGFQAFHPASRAADAELVRGCHAAGLKVRVWTVDDPQEHARLEALGVDAIISNHPRRFARRT